MEGMAPPDVEGMIFQDGAYFVPVEGGYARLPSPLDQLVTPTTPDLARDPVLVVRPAPVHRRVAA